jgi:hypothetical protein
MRTKSMRGVAVDFARYLNEEGDKIALGNAALNARGDLIDTLGNVVRTRAEISAEYHQKNEKSVKQVSIKALDEEVFANPMAAVAALRAQMPQQAQQPQQVTEQPSRPAVKSRRISDSE